MKTHIKMSFDPRVAKELNTDCAIILSNIQFWIAKNQANNKNFHEGKFWTYNSTKAFSELFPYLTERQIKYCLDKLIEFDYLETGNFNASKYDQTRWFSLGTKFEGSILQFCQMENEILSNGTTESVKPIPDSKPDSKPNKKKKIIINNNKKSFSNRGDSIITMEVIKAEILNNAKMFERHIENPQTNPVIKSIDDWVEKIDALVSLYESKGMNAVSFNDFTSHLHNKIKLDAKIKMKALGKIFNERTKRWTNTNVI